MKRLSVDGFRLRTNESVLQIQTEQVSSREVMTRVWWRVEEGRGGEYPTRKRSGLAHFNDALLAGC